MTAAALAGELRLPLSTILLEGIITKFMGETATKLKLVFDTMSSIGRCLLLRRIRFTRSKENSGK